MTTGRLADIDPNSPERYLQQAAKLFEAGRHTDALVAFLETFRRAPAEVVDHMTGVWSGALAAMAEASGRRGELVTLLDRGLDVKPLINKRPPKGGDRKACFDKLKICKRRGLPSQAIVTAPTDRARAATRVLEAGYSLAPVLWAVEALGVIPSWAAEFAEGGACASASLTASAETVARLTDAGIERVVLVTDTAAPEFSEAWRKSDMVAADVDAASLLADPEPALDRVAAVYPRGRDWVLRDEALAALRAL